MTSGACAALQSAAGVTEPEEIEKLCAEGRDAANFLGQYVVQAQLNERGNFGARSPSISAHIRF